MKKPLISFVKNKLEEYRDAHKRDADLLQRMNQQMAAISQRMMQTSGHIQAYKEVLAQIEEVDDDND